jgi:hypothetical protein
MLRRLAGSARQPGNWAQQALISQIENGTANTLERLAAAFDAKLTDLFTTE